MSEAALDGLTITLQWVGGTAIVTFDRAEQRNALRREDLVVLSAHLRSLATAVGLRAMILTGNGAFCSGGDLKSLRSSTARQDVTPALYEVPHDAIQALLEVPVPTIAALDGAAVGMGMDLALACDVRLFGPKGWMRQGWASYGAIPATGGMLFLRSIAPGRTWQVLSGQPRIDAALAQDLGLGQAVRNETALTAALRVGESFAEMSPRALEAYTELAREAVRRDLEPHLALCGRLQAELFNDSAFNEAVSRRRGGGDPS